MTKATSQTIAEQHTEHSKPFARPIQLKGPTLSAEAAEPALSGNISTDYVSG